MLWAENSFAGNERCFNDSSDTDYFYYNDLDDSELICLANNNDLNAKYALVERFINKEDLNRAEIG